MRSLISTGPFSFPFLAVSPLDDELPAPLLRPKFGNPLPFFFCFFMACLETEAEAPFASPPPNTANSTPSTGDFNVFRPACTERTPSNVSTTTPTTPVFLIFTVSPMVGWYSSPCVASYPYPKSKELGGGVAIAFLLPAATRPPPPSKASTLRAAFVPVWYRAFAAGLFCVFRTAAPASGFKSMAFTFRPIKPACTVIREEALTFVTTPAMPVLVTTTSSPTTGTQPGVAASAAARSSAGRFASSLCNLFVSRSARAASAAALAKSIFPVCITFARRSLAAALISSRSSYRI
mmetsp:Transcript_472/g.1854  ORF Transcript_472/g.1854 Transcript_472/m.1854 type:complete len:292 (+) Transcript_472:554-1429(+)